MTTWYILSDLDKICFHCPLPKCNDNDPRCPRRQALAAGNISRRKPALREIQVLDYLGEHPDEQHRIIDVARGTGAPYRSVHHVLRRLRDQNRITATGQGNTLRWTAKSSQRTV